MSLRVLVQRAEKVQQAREDLQERIKSIRCLVSSTKKSVNKIASPTAVEQKSGESPSIRRSLNPQKTPDERHTSISPESLSSKTPGHLSHVDDRFDPIHAPLSVPSAPACPMLPPCRRKQQILSHLTCNVNALLPSSRECITNIPIW